MRIEARINDDNGGDGRRDDGDDQTMITGDSGEHDRQRPRTEMTTETTRTTTQRQRDP